MRVDDLIRKSVVYVGDANSKPFVPHGTGFMAASFIGDSGYQSVVTARHVLEGIGPDVHLRLNRLDGRAQVIPLEGHTWKEHPSGKVDLAAFPTLIPKDVFDIKHIDVDGEMMFTDYKNPEAVFGLGDEVIVAGMFQQRLGETRNLPIIRTGTIAAMPEEKIETSYGYHDAYLVEVRSIDGLSGSPVFVSNSLMQTKDGKLAPTEKLNFKFLGVLLGTNEVINPKDFVDIRQPGTGENDQAGVRTLLNTGIGIVAPADLVIETVKHPETEERRMNAKVQREKERRYRPSSAVTPEPPTKDENPQHKEDFNSLLDAAVTGPESEDQT